MGNIVTRGLGVDPATTVEVSGIEVAVEINDITVAVEVDEINVAVNLEDS